MSEDKTYSRYESEIINLTRWFNVKLTPLNPLHITLVDYKKGIDAIPEEFKKVTNEAFAEWLKHGYELSYNQMCIAFFTAMKNASKLVITDK